MGGSPSAFQRKQLREVIKSADVQSAVLTNSAITALNLFMRNPIRAFAPNDIEQALAYIKAPAAFIPEIKSSLQRLKQELQISI
jgi:hypothetical protein